MLNDGDMSTIVSIYSQIISDYHDKDLFCNKMQKVFNDRKYLKKIFKKLFFLIKKDKELEKKYEEFVFMWVLQITISNKDIEFMLKVLNEIYNNILEEELIGGINELELDEMSSIEKLFKKM